MNIDDARRRNIALATRLRRKEVYIHLNRLREFKIFWSNENVITGSALIIICSLVFLSCSTQPSEQSQSAAEQYQTDVFFDLPAFFDSEIAALGKKGGIKSTSVNGKSEEVTIPELNLRRELQLFIDSDINKMAWVDKYEETIREEKGRQVTTYTAKEEDMVTQILEVFKKEDQVELIYLRKKLSSRILNTEQEMTYRTGEGYSIQVNQTDGLIDGNEYEVEVKYE